MINLKTKVLQIFLIFTLIPIVKRKKFYLIKNKQKFHIISLFVNGKKRVFKLDYNEYVCKREKEYMCNYIEKQKHLLLSFFPCVKKANCITDNFLCLKDNDEHFTKIFSKKNNQFQFCTIK
jgi:hypothetical protein